MASINGHRGLYARPSIRCKTSIRWKRGDTGLFASSLVSYKFNSHLSRELISFQISSAFSPFLVSDEVVIINSYTFNVLVG